ncbi:MAG: TraB/GumN family protein [Saprospiraceae bacterium]|nr:TraB/GumN family protein [Saprospiraceae bacterium]MBP9210732.1 TraB/GumN family protein [Saprospiraceae bacterium]
MGFSSGMLWKVSGRQSSESYLFGTLHVRSDKMDASFPALEQRLFQCERFAAEIDVDAISITDAKLFFHMPSGQRWTECLTGPKLQKLMKRAERSFGVDLRAHEHTYPLLLAHQILAKGAGLDEQGGLDLRLWTVAKEKGLECFGLEELSEHFGALAQIPIRRQLDWLDELLREPSVARKRVFRLISKYEAGDLAYVYRWSKRMLGPDRKHMLYERNNIMFQKILQTIDAGPCFYTCGAAHLYGAYGLLRKLKHAGYRLTNYVI